MNLQYIRERLDAWERLTRLDKPIGTLLLLWPTLWAVWIASRGTPEPMLVWIYCLGTLLMRSAGCIMNDLADRKFDGHVKRTARRPLVTGEVSVREAVWLTVLLLLAAFCLILPLNTLTLWMSLPAVLIAASYPLFKRFFAIPQAYLGVAFGFGIPMAFASCQNELPALAWWLLLANIFWAIAYDTEYAMVDRDDDIRIGIRTSAITFGRYDVLMVMLSYAAMLLVLGYVGYQLGMGWPYYAGLLLALAIAGYHYTLIRTRTREGCFRAFNHNNWLGAAVFAGIAGEYWRLHWGLPGSL